MNMEIKKLKELGSNLTVLYMEDEKEIRQQLEEILKNFFKTVIVAQNGKEGVELFEKHDFDLVITDIQMPQKTGLEAAREIKSLKPHIPIVVTTAYSDVGFFITSIELGIDRYILKPISMPNLFEALLAVCNGIVNRQKAEILAQKELLEEINSTASDLMQKLSNAFPNPAIVFDGRELKFVNESFAMLFGEANIKSIKNKTKKLDDFFVQENGFIYTVEEINEADYSKNKVLLSINGKKRIFLLAKQKLTAIDSELQIYTFSNITKIEYEKIKNQTYAELLQELLFVKYKRETSLPEKVAKSASSEQDKDNKKEYLYLSSDEKEILRKSHGKKYSAAEYIKEMDQDLMEEIDEFAELESEWKELLMDFEEKISKETIDKIATIIEKYSKTIAVLIEFEDLAYALKSITKVLEDLELSSDNAKVLGIFLESIRADLADWRDKIFVRKSSKDIHYLDSSLFSSCLQLQLKLGIGEAKIEDEENDLELF